MDRHLILLFGNIASGKSTLAKKLNKAGYIIVSTDGIRNMFHPAEYKFDEEETYAIVEAEKMAVSTLLSLNRNVVIDDAGNCLGLRRKWALEEAKKFCYKVIAIEMPFYSRAVSVKRRLKNNHGKYGADRWSMVYDMFQKNYNPPTKKEGFDAIYRSNSAGVRRLLEVA